MAFELLGFSGTALYVLLAAIFVLTQYLGIHSILPMTKKSAGMVGVGGIILALFMGGVIAMPGQVSEEEGPTGPQQMQYLDVTYEGSATNVTDHDVADSITVEFYENTSSGNLLADDGTTDLSSVQFDIALHRIDQSTDNDVVFGVTASQIQVDNADADDSPFDVFDETTNDKASVKITPSGGTGTYGYNNVLISAAGDKTVTINADTILDEWGQNLETYDEASETGWITITGPNGGVQHTIEITFLKIGTKS